jgi:hypothetical protein
MSTKTNPCQVRTVTFRVDDKETTKLSVLVACQFENSGFCPLFGATLFSDGDGVYGVWVEKQRKVDNRRHMKQFLMPTPATHGADTEIEEKMEENDDSQKVSFKKRRAKHQAVKQASILAEVEKDKSVEAVRFVVALIADT